MKKSKFAWKVIKKDMKSNNGNHIWKKNKWYKFKGDIKICNSGFHASKLLIYAMQYITPGVICLVEYKNIIEEQHDKFVCSDMKIVKTYRFTKKMAIELAIYSARLCLNNFESKYHSDKRPRLAIKSAEKYLKSPTKKNKQLAKSTAESAWSATKSATRSATWSATKSAESSAESSAYKKIERKLLKIIGYKSWRK